MLEEEEIESDHGEDEQEREKEVRTDEDFYSMGIVAQSQQ